MRSSDALSARLKIVFRHAPTAPALMRASPAARADDGGDWDAVIASAKMRASSPQGDDDADWDAVIARAKMRASSPQADDDADWDAVIARAKMRASSRPIG
jgi:hypothetical protein